MNIYPKNKAPPKAKFDLFVFIHTFIQKELFAFSPYLLEHPHWHMFTYLTHQAK